MAARSSARRMSQHRSRSGHVSEAARRAKPDMSQFRSVDTAPEWAVRRILHALGFRYRVHFKGLPGKPDIVFTRKRKVIFVHGCFWHHHLRCKRATIPATNVAYWRKKLAYNRARDAKHLAALRKAGWRSLVVWECETRQTEGLTRTLISFLDG